MAQRYSSKRRYKKRYPSWYYALITILVLIVIAALVLVVFNHRGVLRRKALEKFYPVKYSEYVEKYSEEFDVDKNLVYAVIKCESDFNPEDESSAGAMGLMQMVPDTFRFCQEKLDGEVTHDTEDLFDPETSIKYGTYYLKYLLERYDGDERLAIAAYNAGETNVDEWLSVRKYSNDGKTLNEIPFPETREYVKKVESARDVYREIY